MGAIPADEAVRNLQVVNLDYPSYLRLSRKEFKTRIERAFDLTSPCRLCPRECGVDRLAGEIGFCGAGAHAVVSSYTPHPGEEPPLSGYHGSGTIFFTHCNLRCVFCQNYPISQLGHGNEETTEALADMMLSLERRSCHNINFVTPTHMMPWILKGLYLAIEGGLRTPLVYNTGGYDTLEALQILDGIIDIYLPDMKYDDPEVAKKYSSAPDYPEVNRIAIKEMHRQVGELVLDEEGIAIRGMIVRHLVLPKGLAGSEGILNFLARDVSPHTAVSLMAQYFPAYRADEFPEINEILSRQDYQKAVLAMERAGLDQGWRQR